MLRSTLSRHVSVLLGAILISSCSDAAFQGPHPVTDAVSVNGANASLKGAALGAPLTDLGNLQLKALWWKKKPGSVVSVSRPIGPAGGTIQLPAVGLTVVFPPGALKVTKTITVTPDDKYVAYKMEPSGTTFDKDVTVTQLLSLTEIAGAPLRTQLFAAYVRDDNAKLNGQVTISKIDIQPSQTILSRITGLPEAQVWVIRHFSRYMLSSG